LVYTSKSRSLNEVVSGNQAILLFSKSRKFEWLISI